MEQQIKNSQKIIDAYCEEQNRFEVIKQKAQICLNKNAKIEGMISDTIDIFSEVFKNFYAERKPLDIFLISEHYDEGKLTKQWISGKANLPDKYKYNYTELCLNTMGLTLLPSYGNKSYNIIEGGRHHSSTLYNILALNNKIVIDTLKPILKKEKMDLLNKILAGVEILKYDAKFLKQQSLGYIGMKGEYNEDKKAKKINGKFIHFEASGLYSLSFRISEQEKMDYEYETFNLIRLSFEQSMVVEQISEEIIQNLDEYILFLENKEKAVEKYFLETKDKFIKELICLNLKGQKI